MNEKQAKAFERTALRIKKQSEQTGKPISYDKAVKILYKNLKQAGKI